MSKMEITSVLHRIEGTSADSPLLVLSTDNKHYVVCYFAKTYHSQQIIHRQPSHFIGVFDGTMDMTEVSLLIKQRVLAS